MSKRQVIVLWVLALALTAALVVVKSSEGDGFQSSTRRERGQTLLADFPAAEVARIEIRAGGKTTTLQQSDGAWTVANRDGYPANSANVNGLIRQLAEVKVTQGIDADASFAPRFGMDPAAGDAADQGTEIVLGNDSGAELARLTLGKNLEGAADPMSPFGGGGSSGRFIRNAGDDSGVYVVSELFPTLSADPQGWLDESFLRVEKIKSVSVSEPGKPDTVAWKLARASETDDFTLADIAAGETLDPAASGPIKSLFSYARFDDVVPAADATDMWVGDQKRKAILETFEGFTYTLTFGPAKAEEPAAAADPATPPAAESFLMTVEVAGSVPAERKKADDEKEEDAKQLQEAFDKRRQELEGRLAADQKLAGHTFKVSKFTVDALLKDRATMLKSATPAPAATALPPGGTPPANAPRRPIQAVTPPIAIPPLPEQAPAEEPEQQEPAAETGE